jgi:hypothetical protein
MLVQAHARERRSRPASFRFRASVGPILWRLARPERAHRQRPHVRIVPGAWLTHRGFEGSEFRKMRHSFGCWRDPADPHCNALGRTAAFPSL